MLPRVLETEAMDTIDEAVEYDAMDHHGVNARFVADFLRAHGACRGGPIIDIGTGPAQIPILLCRADPSARVLGIDLARAMIEGARVNVGDAGLDDRITLAEGDAKSLKLASDSFEAVISNSIVHHIPDPAPAIAEMARIVAPGGTVMVRDLSRPDDEEAVSQLVAEHAGKESIPARDLFRASLHAALRIEEIRAIVGALGMSVDGVSMTSDRHWTWVWRKPS